MKKVLLQQFGDWFGFTRRQRRSTSILLLLIVITGLSRFLIPQRDVAVEEISLGSYEACLDSLIVNGGQYSEEEGKPEQEVIRRKIVPVDLNRCDSAALEALPGIGPVLSARIIKYRYLIGGYASVDQLKEIYGLSKETFNLVSERVTADPSDVRIVNGNSADYRQMIRLPYLDAADVTSILNYRKMKGTIRDINDLVENNIITPEKANKSGPYLDFR
jgi:DNA uptake protein ComE-like DNA-binding protein